ncbi:MULTISPECIES: single-stranded DNA-binding protein [Nocardiaceae]|jgi:single-strand DNA-binding protein|uniref:single-stranded DNA-binding protein n=1 Tax=Nocardiaceae TaxID=85025 RepID=UPI00056D7EC5|nr:MULTISPECIES: single-stranded DNA-binding protein [Rhodococcus]OZE96171.1 single-stranded DNA-binding protein [Rhodococcus sp. 15-1189-1-1a]OZF10718.1 single-stranded DNA-binding protein [Rhodococcus sp. 14-2686-1-2]OZF46391.1 single-stranded DNA-binding protein [Rhodococcus sp. 14-2470-1b]
MYEAQCAVVGTVITNPVKRSTASGDEVLSFRMASNARRQDRATGEWTDGGTLFLTVTCWRRLVKGVGGSLMKGDPVIAYGQLRTNEYTTREGIERSAVEMTASAIGPDLARCIVKVERVRTVIGGESDEPSGATESGDPGVLRDSSDTEEADGREMDDEPDFDSSDASGDERIVAAVS